MHGKGIIEFANGAIYEGEWKQNRYNGFGEFTKANGEKTKGEWIIGK